MCHPQVVSQPMKNINIIIIVDYSIISNVCSDLVLKMSGIIRIATWRTWFILVVIGTIIIFIIVFVLFPLWWISVLRSGARAWRLVRGTPLLMRPRFLWIVMFLARFMSGKILFSRMRLSLITLVRFQLRWLESFHMPIVIHTFLNIRRSLMLMMPVVRAFIAVTGARSSEIIILVLY